MRAPRRKRARRLAGLSVVPKLRMTSMMDILTVLLLFLLKSFVVDGESLTPPPGLELPQSTSDSLPQESIHLALEERGVLLGEDLVATADQIMQAPGFEIAPLAARLQGLQRQSDRIAQLQGREPRRTATIQGDKDLQFAMLQKVMYTLSVNGYGDISLAVIKKS
jgi:biopolymer transport protein ExbD